MSGPNMICPKCRTFQPSAETCRECGAVVAKLWTRRGAKAKGEEKPPAPARGAPIVSPRAAAAFGIVAIAIAGGWWLLAAGDRASGEGAKRTPAENPYLAAAREAQRQAEAVEERLRAASGAVEMGGTAYVTATPIGPGDLDVDLDAFAAELNAVSPVDTVALQGADLQQAFRSCVRRADQYFGPLRYRERDRYPLPTPQTEPYRPGPYDARVRCEGDAGTVYAGSAPRTRAGIDACWSRERGTQGSVWVRMQWDRETARWSIYTGADQRAVDRVRLAEARLQLPDDLRLEHAARQRRARERIPELVASVEALRGELAAAGDARRRKLEREIAREEARLRVALVDERYPSLCEAAASAALDARERRL